MKLYELGTGEPVQVLVKVENASAEYDSTVAFGKEGILLIEPIRYDGKIINFSGDKVHISVIYMEDGIKPLIWEGCRMQTVQAGKEKYHAIVCKRDGIKWNRRQAYRQYLGLDGMLSIDSTRANHSVVVKDISATGVSFVGMPDMNYLSMGPFHLTFEDKASRLKVQLSGIAVRQEPVDETKVIVGCTVKQANLDLGTYVASKQKQEIARRHGN